MRIRIVAITAGILLSVNASAQWLPSPPTGSGPIYYNGGSVGIGTSSPLARLSVVGAGNNAGAAYFEDFLSHFGLGLGVLSVLDKTLPTAQFWNVGGNISLRGVFRSDGATGSFGGIKAGKANNIDGNLDSFLALYTRSMATGNTEKLRIDELGRVGIGTTTPAAKLHVVGDVLVTGNITGVIGALNGASGALNVNEPTGVELEAFTNTPNLFMQLGKSDSSASFRVLNHLNQSLFEVQGDGFTVFRNSGMERMRLNPNGNVAINYFGSHNSRLIVQHGVDNSSAVLVSHQPTVETNATQTDKGLELAVTESVLPGVTNSGRLLGMHSTTSLNSTGTLSELRGAQIDTGTTAAGTIDTVFGLMLYSAAAAGSTIGTGYGVYLADVKANSDWGIFQVGTDDSNYFAGNVTIGTTTPMTGKKLYVQGDAHFDGTVTGTKIRAHYQDVAEWVPSSEELAPGMVVVLDKRSGNTVKASHAAYDTAVAGVVSADPGVILGEEGPSKEQIATTGRVRVRVDASKGGIEIGDLLVTSDTPGMAMKSAPIEFGGVSIHRPGTIVGKALEALPDGKGEILVLLSMQ